MGDLRCHPLTPWGAAATTALQPAASFVRGFVFRSSDATKKQEWLLYAQFMPRFMSLISDP